MKKTRGGGSDGRIDAFDLRELHNSRTFLEADPSDEVS
jgi:hypothetical protein